MLSSTYRFPTGCRRLYQSGQRCSPVKGGGPPQRMQVGALTKPTYCYEHPNRTRVVSPSRRASAFACQLWLELAIAPATQDSPDDASAARPLFPKSGHDGSREARGWGCPVAAVRAKSTGAGLVTGPLDGEHCGGAWRNERSSRTEESVDSAPSWRSSSNRRVIAGPIEAPAFVGIRKRSSASDSVHIGQPASYHGRPSTAADLPAGPSVSDDHRGLRPDSCR